jgi:FO synthase
MGDAGEPGLIDLMSACAIARVILGAHMNIQAPPNLSADYGPLLVSGINDWGGISTVTPDYINPEAPWPELDQLAQLCREAGYDLRERLTIYPEYVHRDEWLDPGLRTRVRARCDDSGYPVV